MSVKSLPKTVTRQRRDCDFYPGPSAPESSTLTTRLPSQPIVVRYFVNRAPASKLRTSAGRMRPTCGAVFRGIRRLRRRERGQGRLYGRRVAMSEVRCPHDKPTSRGKCRRPAVVLSIVGHRGAPASDHDDDASYSTFVCSAWTFRWI